MALEWRNGRLYRYAKIRQGRRVVSVYLGDDGRGEALIEAHRRDIAERRRIRQEARRAATAIWEARQAELATLDAQMVEFSQLADSVFCVTMESGGWRLYKRQWRRGRLTVRTSSVDISLSEMPLGHDITFALKQTLVERFAGNDFEKQLDAHAMMQAWRAELAGPFPTDTESILIERIVICRFNALLADLDVEEGLGSLTPGQLGALEKRRSGCHRRLLSAVKALETLRRALPEVTETVSKGPRSGLLRVHAPF
jgi:hypothetical protein